MPAPNQNEELSQLDLAFCVDLTRSMAPFIHAAQQHMSGILRSLSGNTKASLRTAVVGYRDYGAPGSDPIELHPFADNLQAGQQALNQLQVFSPPENSDAAEAVFAGLFACTQRLQWRPRAFKIVVLVGDAPPHGLGVVKEPNPDRFPQKDPSGQTLDELSALLEGNGLTLYSMGMLPSTIPAHDQLTEESFSKMASMTGGMYRRARSSQDAIAIVEAIGQKVFGELAFDRKIFEEMQRQGIVSAPGAPAPAPAMMAAAAPQIMAQLGVSKDEMTASVARLSKRKIIDDKK